MASVSRILPTHIPDAWPEEALARAVPSNLDQMRERCEAGDYQLWRVGERAWCVVETVDEYAERLLVVRALAGEGIESWRRALTDALLAHARREGCQHIRCLAHNPRLADAMASAGWHTYARIMEYGDGTI